MCRDRCLSPESYADGDVVGPAAQIDLRSGEPIVEVGLGAVVADLAAGADGLAAETETGAKLAMRSNAACEIRLVMVVPPFTETSLLEIYSETVRAPLSERNAARTQLS